MASNYISFNLFNFVWISVVTYFWGIRRCIFVLGYGACCIFIQENINYVEHYGLQRKKDNNGIYESINIMHSWNSPQKYSNYIMFKLQRHSDHHVNVYKPNQTLDNFDESPQLFGGMH